MVGIGATVLSGIAAQIFTYQSTRSLSSDEFQRTERRTAYAELNAKAKAFELVEDRADTEDFKTRFTASPETQERAKRRLDEMAKQDEARTLFTNAAAAVELVGSGSALVATLKLRDAHNDADWAFSSIFQASIEWTLAPPEDDAKNLQNVEHAITNYEAKRRLAGTARREFVDAARDDLGIKYDLQWTPEAAAERQRFLWMTIAALVATTLAAIATRRQWSCIAFGFGAFFLLRALLLYYGQDGWWTVGSAVGAACVPFVVYRMWKTIGAPSWVACLPSTRSRILRWGMRRQAVAQLVNWRYRRKHPAAKQPAAAVGENGSDKLT